jgi:hypothetical protein
VRGGVALLLWLALGVAVWNGFFDLYVSRGAREYGQLRVEFELGRGPNPDMTGVLVNAQRDGVRAATLWGALVTGAGLATFYWARRSRS